MTRLMRTDRRRGARRRLRYHLGKEVMIITLRASIAVFTLGIGSAYAGDGDGHSATTMFTAIQTERIAHAHTIATQPPVDPAQTGAAAVRTSDARAPSHGSWLLRVFSLP
jgi:hypothetical protein